MLSEEIIRGTTEEGLF